VLIAVLVPDVILWIPDAVINGQPR
jgi:hypothetical protein